MKHYFVYTTIKKELLEDCQIHLEYESSFLSVDSTNIVILQLELEFISKILIPYMKCLHTLSE